MDTYSNNRDNDNDNELTSANTNNELAVYDMPGHLVRRLNQIAVSIFLDGTRAFGITPVQFSALTAIGSVPGIDQRRLSRVIAFDRSTIGDVVQRLEKRGLVISEKRAADRRTKHLFLSAEGIDTLSAMQGAVWKTNDDLLKSLSEGERTIFMFLLKKLVHLNNEMSRAPLVPDDQGPAILVQKPHTDGRDPTIPPRRERPIQSHHHS
ncbi:MAG: MarR family transcriptional regulator [Acidimicrobiaceae bacterium]|nr:MarR family transcriptional regulator [Acidimicrobiaceae bacterium]